MSSRERWTVYPLLFLTLGIAMTDKVTRTVDTDQVVCRSLLVTDRLGKPQVVVGMNEAGGIVQMQSASQGVNVLVGHTGRLAGLLFADPQGRWIQPSRASMRVAPRSNRAPADSKSQEPKRESRQAEPPSDPTPDDARPDEQAP
jgi:hypothetical protein